MLGATTNNMILLLFVQIFAMFNEKQNNELQTLYHEKQEWPLALCLVHSFNNICQKRCTSKLDCDKICLQLDSNSFINPYRSFWGTGDYDYQVLNQLCEQHLFDLEFYYNPGQSNDSFGDFREKLDELLTRKSLLSDDLKGFIINFQPLQTNLVKKFGSLLFSGRHWFAVLNIGGVWMNLDSNLAEPSVIGDSEEALRIFIYSYVDNFNGHLAVIKKKQ